MQNSKIGMSTRSATPKPGSTVHPAGSLCFGWTEGSWGRELGPSVALGDSTGPKMQPRRLGGTEPCGPSTKEQLPSAEGGAARNRGRLMSGANGSTSVRVTFGVVRGGEKKKRYKKQSGKVPYNTEYQNVKETR